MKSAILDASALIAVIRGEPGIDVVLNHMSGAVISTINLSEVFYKLMAHGMDLEWIQSAVQSLQIRCLDFDGEQAAIAATLLATTYKKGISFADRACLALGIARELPVITSDKVWGELELELEVINFREAVAQTG